jgi:hypothetical protein
MLANKLAENKMWCHASKFILGEAVEATTDTGKYKIVKTSAQLVKNANNGQPL